MFKLNSLYVSAKDFGRAEVFYSKTLFGRKPDMRTDRFIFFDLSGVLFGIFNPKITEETIAYGNNCAPTLQVPELEMLYKRLTKEDVDIVMPLQEVNDTVIFQCRDTEGNVLEFYRWKSATNAKLSGQS